MMKNYLLVLMSILMSYPSLFAQFYEWGGTFGGDGEDVVRAMAVDDDGNVYTTGYFTDNSDMDPTELVDLNTSNGFFDVFVQKVDTDGNLVWVKTFGADFFDYGTGIEVDNDGNVYVTGVYQETVDFDPSEASFELTSSGAEDIFVLKLNSSGDFVWVKGMGGEGYEEPVSVGIDGNGNVYVAGYFQISGDYDPGEGEAMLTSNGGQDAFIVKLDDNGNYLWSGNLGGPELDLCLGMDVAENGDVYISGSFSGTADFDISEGVASYTSMGDFDAYVTKLNPLGAHVFTAAIGGTGADIAWDVALDDFGNVYAAGGFRGEFETGIPEPVQSGPGNENVFVSKVNPFGMLEWSACMLGEQFANAYDVNTDSEGRVILSGYFADEIDFDPSEGEFILTRESTEPFDAFVARYNADGSLDFAANFGGSNFVEHHGIDTDAQSNIYLAAGYQNTVDIDPTENTDEVTSVAFRDSYIIKLTSDLSVSAQEVSMNQLSLYPNPAIDHIQMNAELNSPYSIFDMTGKVIQSGNIVSGYVDVRQLTGGVYMIMIEGYHPSRFVKQ